MIARNVDQITEEDLQALVDNSVVERKTLEYKQALPSNSDSDKKEFLADVSSFANASGGDLIFGITSDKKTGTPKSADGLSIENADQEILRLENMIRDGIGPRISSVSTKSISLSNLRDALLIRIPKSWISPHRVTFKGHDKFYSRSSNGKYPLDVAELRVAFNLSETITERIRKFREDRLGKIFANETPVPFYENAKIVLHLVPISAFNPAQSYDIAKIASHPGKIIPIGTMGGRARYNLDGFLTYVSDNNGKSFSYVQLFRNGIIEAVEGLMLEPNEWGLTIPSGLYEHKLIESCSNYFSVLNELTIEHPFFIFLTLLGVKGYSMAVDKSRFSIHEIHTIDRDILLLPEIVIENNDGDAAKLLKPCFDAIWNACGFSRSFNYNDKGEWAPPR